MLLAPVLVLAPSRVLAQTEEARGLFQQGQAAAEEERWSEALEFFRRAYELDERPFILRNIGVCLRVLGRHVESMVVYQQLLRVTDDAAQQEEIRGWIEEARRSVATLTLQLDPPDAQVFVDGEPIAGQGAVRRIPLDPGDHSVLVTAEGHANARHPLSALSGQDLSWEARLVPTPTPTAPDDEGGIEESPLFWTLLGVGVAAVIGVVIGALLYDPGVEPVEPGTLGSVTTLLERW